ncbi:MAG: patatin-like phospholipase family protein, partial [Chloroflexi bacterium]|nr:patatin-like phospholipase family protein [Chloroflexota bacterium]
MPQKTKTALVLAGGGLTGAVYEIGALRAIDDLLLDRTVNDFDIYVGTSAGALISALLANGVSPEDMLRALEGENRQVEPLRPHHLFGINPRDSLRWGLRLPHKLVGSWLTYLTHLREMTFFDFLWSLSDALPAGIYDSLALEGYVRKTLHALHKHNHFADLDRELLVIATDLADGGRVVFGRDRSPETTISMAVAASSAIPLVYKPVLIEGREYVDGGLRGNASLDLAIERGAELIICINPLAPVGRAEQTGANKRAARSRRLGDDGIQAIANQTLRITSHAGLHYHIKQLRRAHPHVDIILIEPDSRGRIALSDNMMRYSARLTAARHGFESVTLNLAEDYPLYKQTLARH